MGELVDVLSDFALTKETTPLSPVCCPNFFYYSPALCRNTVFFLETARFVTLQKDANNHLCKTDHWIEQLIVSTCQNLKPAIAAIFMRPPCVPQLWIYSLKIMNLKHANL